MRDKSRLRYAAERFSDALERLTEATQEQESALAIDGTIQRFEFTFELAWNTMQRFIRFEGNECRSPRSCLKQAFSIGLISNEELWLDMIDDRNMTSHIYDEAQAKRIYDRIKSEYLMMLASLLKIFREKAKD